jgi:hypothetical protein
MAKYKNYDMQPNEVVILKKDRIRHGGFMASYTDELILTNLNLVLISKGAFGNIKNVQKFPLHQIKIFDGKAQAVLSEPNYGMPQLDVYFLNGQESFCFGSFSQKDVIQFVNNINKLLTGNENEVASKTIPGTEYIAEAIKGTVDVFKDALGIHPKTPTSQAPEKIAGKCNSCGAPIFGTVGQVVRCQYCNADQQL